MFCPSCGAAVSAGATFCARCGATLPTPPPSAPLGAARPSEPAAPPAPGVGPAPGLTPEAASGRPKLSVGDALTASFSQAFGNFGVFARTQGIFVLGAAAVSLVFSIVFVGPGVQAIFASMLAGGEEPDLGALFAAIARLVALGLLAGLLALALNVLGAAVGITVASALHRGERLTLGEAWERTRPRLGNFLLTMLLFAGAILGVILAGTALILLVLPILAAIVLAFYLAVRWAVAPAVSLAETRAPRENLERASELTAGSRGAIFLVFLVLTLVTAVPSAIVGGATSPDVPDPSTATQEEILEAATPTIPQLVVQAAVGAVVQLISASVGSAFIVYAYRTLAGAPAA